MVIYHTSCPFTIQATRRRKKADVHTSAKARHSEYPMRATGASAASLDIQPDTSGETSISELENFNNGVKVIQLTKDVNRYRYYGGLAAPMGRYLSNGALNSAVDRTGLAILPKWNKMEELQK